MRKIISIFAIFLMPAIAFAGSLPGDANSPADKAVKSAIDLGKIIPCDSSDGSCKGMEMNYRVFGFPTEGNFHVGQYAEFKDNGGWKLVKVFQKPDADAPAPEAKDVQFLSASKVKVTYHFRKDRDPNCCSTGLGAEILILQ